MKELKQIYQIGITDLKVRIREKNVLLIALLMMYVGYLFFPDKASSIYYSFYFTKGGELLRGVYNSAWMGWMGTIAFISLISLMGFYFVRNGISKERHCGVGSITAATPISKGAYVTGKAFGSWMFLLIQMAVVMGISLIMQQIRGEAHGIDWITFGTPFLLYAVPVCLLIAVIAIGFESVPILSAGIGNLVYFFLWTFMMGSSVAEKTPGYFTDILGLKSTVNALVTAANNTVGVKTPLNDYFIGYAGVGEKPLKLLSISQIHGTREMLLCRGFWFALTLCALWLIGMIFSKKSLTEKKQRASGQGRTKKSLGSAGIVSKGRGEEKRSGNPRNFILASVKQTSPLTNCCRIFAMETNFYLKAVPMVLWGIWVGLTVASFMASENLIYKLLIPLLWILPIFTWSKCAVLQRNHNTENYFMSFGSYRKGQLIIQWLAMLTFTECFMVGPILRTLIFGKLSLAVALFFGGIFVSGLGLLLGNTLGSTTAFEILYMIAWYIGVLNGMPLMDFLGLSEKAWMLHTPIYFGAAGLGMTAMAALAKQKRKLV